MKDFSLESRLAAMVQSYYRDTGVLVTGVTLEIRQQCKGGPKYVAVRELTYDMSPSIVSP